jgi:hypothetical protein
MGIPGASLGSLPRARPPPSQALHPLFAADEEAGVRDNALGAVGRLLTAPLQPSLPPPGPAASAPEPLGRPASSAGCAGLLPLESVLPVFLGALPLRDDLKEAPAVYGALCGLLTGGRAGGRGGGLLRRPREAHDYSMIIP